MALETVVNIADLVAANPSSSDPKSQGDDHIRNLKTALLNDFAGFTGAVMVTGVDGGVANAYTLTPANAVVAYGVKMAVVFAPTVTNTATSTINISGLGARYIYRVDGSAVVAGDLVAGSAYQLTYSGTAFVLQSVTKNYLDTLIAVEAAARIAATFNTALPGQTGQAGKFVTTDGTNASWSQVYPTQTGQAGKYLTTDGTNTSWGVLVIPAIEPLLFYGQGII